MQPGTKVTESLPFPNSIGGIANLRIGSIGNSGTEFSGLIHTVYWTDTALSPAQIEAKMMNYGLCDVTCYWMTGYFPEMGIVDGSGYYENWEYWEMNDTLLNENNALVDTDGTHLTNPD